MVEIGKFNELRFIKKTENGLILTEGEKEVLLPYVYAPEGAEIGDNLHVFVYIHSDGRLMATTETPIAQVDEFAFLEVVDENENGAFMDMGIGKDVFVPNKEQKRPMKIGQKYVVFLYNDEKTERITASSYLSDFINQDEHDFEEGDEVRLLITDESDLGFSAIINQRFMGLLYRNEVFEDLKPGDQKRGFIKKIREGNKIDLSLQVIGFKHILDLKDSLMIDLEESNGSILLGDKSSPEDIYNRLKISKKAFKKAIGSLYKERLITISDHEIKLVPKEKV
ncbi:MAG: RNA-binding protein [Sphingobacteriales bacterium 17-39-43]|uniref:CvfB family protein n=1 Tax=Daejeonella sp. TaxID=2805397 RepID=UPI000BD30027|nr:S1-like domain-containing RNA-binding protein [Daejeonella sp.]MCF8452270.1 RNA-binding protein [Pedobacter sp.]OYZ32424.1 MAG: RNA-binding protein [Sphingobacteriales bacterium 16-39-50]OYZ59812.1 MAG: RNA-binding protein [Sphingobacteriales bacterium 24-40-4]OZA25787.1 MAG: RNA-binding protein [Sphingobacteriales bacterium 17-39-43]OZA62211.1 MAG: RNA-binding protein [Sphingobacteriales bacterium 39-40-5]